MHEGIVHVLQVDSIRGPTHPQITFREEIQVGVVGQQHPDSYVKLPFVDEERALDILLDDEGVKLDFIY